MFIILEDIKLPKIKLNIDPELKQQMFNEYIMKGIVRYRNYSITKVNYLRLLKEECWEERREEFIKAYDKNNFFEIAEGLVETIKQHFSLSKKLLVTCEGLLEPDEKGVVEISTEALKDIASVLKDVSASQIKIVPEGDKKIKAYFEREISKLNKLMELKS